MRRVHTRRRRPLTTSPFRFEILEPRLVLTNVSGVLSKDTVWTRAGSPYVLVGGGVIVNAGVTLRIESGVTVTSVGPDIQVRGTLSASGVTFSGDKLSITAFNKGSVGISGSTVSEGDVVFLSGSKGSVKATTFAGESSLQLNTNAVTVAGNAFRGTRPAIVAPDLVGLLSTSAFTGKDAVITVSGVTTKSGTLSPIGTVRHYAVSRLGVTVSAGTTLSVASGLTITSDDGDILVKKTGTLTASGVTFVGAKMTVAAEDGGRIDVAASTFSDSVLKFARGSKGGVKTTTFARESSLALFSSTVTVSSNTFQARRPVSSAPDLVGRLATSTFTGTDAVISLFGATTAPPANTTTAVSWAPMGTVRRYDCTNVIVSAGTSVSVRPGVTVVVNGPLTVRGSLTSSAATIVGPGTVNVFGTIATDLGLLGPQTLTLEPGSRGRISKAILGRPAGTISVANTSLTQIKGCDIEPTMSVRATGTKGSTIDLSGNWWGVDANTAVGRSTVDAAITDAADNGNFPKITYAPALAANGTGQVVPTLTMNTPVAARVSIPYRGESWTFTGIAGQVVTLDVLDTRDAAGRAPGTPGAIDSVAIEIVGPRSQKLLREQRRDTRPFTLTETGIYTVSVRGIVDRVGGSIAFQLVSDGVTSLQPGQPRNGTFAGPYQTLPYSVTLAQGGVLAITVDSVGETAEVEVYVAKGRAPNLRDYDHRSSVRGPDQTVVIPAAGAGEWRVMLFTRKASPGTPFTVKAETASVRIASATPGKGIVGQTLTMTVDGAGFDAGTAFTLVGPESVAPSATTIVSSGRVMVTFPLTGRKTGQYNLHAAKADGGTAVLGKPISVVTPTAGAFEAKIVLPQALGRHQPATIIVRYANNGSEPIPAPFLVLGSSDPDNTSGSVGIREVPILSLDASKLARGFWASTMPEGFAPSVSFLADGAVAGLLQPGEEVEVPVTFGGLLKPWDMNDRVTNFSLRVIRAGDTTPIDWTSLGSSLKPAMTSEESWKPLLANLRAAVGATWGEFVTMLDANASYLASIGATTRDAADLLALEVRRADGFGILPVLASSIDASLPTPGGGIALERTFGSGVMSRNTSGPFGYGWSTPWMTRLSTETDGDVVVVLPTESVRRFHPDSRSFSRYLSATGDPGVLSRRAEGGFVITERDGGRVAFDTSGRVVSITDPSGRSLNATWSGQSLVKLAHSSGASLTITTKPGSSLIDSVIDSSGRKTTYTYDAAGRHLIAVTTPDGVTIRYTYGNGSADPHALTSVKLGDGPTRTLRYSTANGRLLATGVGGQDETTFTYGVGGRVTAKDAAGITTTVALDSVGLPRQYVDGLGRPFSLSYDSQGRLTATTDARGRTRRISYDAAGRVASVTDPAGARITYVNDAPFGDLSRMVDSRGQATSFTYDSKGNPTGVTYADGTRETWTDYDPQGLPRTYVNGRGQTVAIEYWPNGRMKKQTMPDGSTVAFEYDVAGNLTRLTDKTGTTTYRYDAAGRLASVTSPTGRSLEYGYDGSGRRTSLRQSDGFSVSYTYVADRLDKIIDGASVVIVDYDYDKAGRVIRQKFGNGTATAYEYLADGRVGTVAQLDATGKRMAFETYAYDDVGRVATMDLQTGTTAPDGRWTYGYDESGRLTSAVFVPFAGSSVAGQTLKYSYDSAGNRTAAVVNGVTTTYSTANKVNAIEQVGSDILTYDKDGNLIARSGAKAASYTYDAVGRITSMTQGGTTWTWTYDGLGHRVSEQVNGLRTDYLYDPLSPQAPVAATTNGTTTHFVGVDGISAVNDASGYRYLHANVQGSVTLVTGSGGAGLARYAYRPFGETILDVGGLPNPYRFLGGHGVETESNGLLLTPARALQVSDGVFLGRDPKGEVGGNPYHYSFSDPLSFVDPTGEWPDWIKAADGFLSTALGVTTAFGAAAGLSAGLPVAAATLTFAVFLGGVSTAVAGFGNLVLGLTGDKGEIPELPFFSAKGTAQLFGGNIKEAEWIDTVVSFGTTNFKHLARNGRDIVPEAAMFLLSRLNDELRKLSGKSDEADGAVAASVDPNEKTGAAGVGPERWIAADATIPYEIKFENYGPGSKDIDANGVEKPVDRSRWATAPAQQVDITDTFVPQLDLATFELDEIGFGSVRVSVPDGLQSFETTVPFTQMGQRLEVQIAAFLDTATRRFNVRFQTIDPITQLPPAVDRGFLVPEDGNGNGMGFVRFHARPIAGLPTGTRITNIATIAFDGQVAIATDQIDPLDPSKGTSVARQAFNTIDAGIMSSTVSPLPSVTTTASFTVSWAASGTKTGTPVVGYDIYVQEDDSAVRLWLQNTPATNAVFQGKAGRRYAFYSRARDGAGNLESAPSAFDAKTLVSGSAS